MAGSQVELSMVMPELVWGVTLAELSILPIERLTLYVYLKRATH